MRQLRTTNVYRVNMLPCQNQDHDRKWVGPGDLGWNSWVDEPKNLESQTPPWTLPAGGCDLFPLLEKTTFSLKRPQLRQRRHKGRSGPSRWARLLGEGWFHQIPSTKGVSVSSTPPVGMSSASAITAIQWLTEYQMYQHGITQCSGPRGRFRAKELQKPVHDHRIHSWHIITQIQQE